MVKNHWASWWVQSPPGYLCELLKSDTHWLGILVGPKPTWIFVWVAWKWHSLPYFQMGLATPRCQQDPKAPVLLCHPPCAVRSPLTVTEGNGVLTHYTRHAGMDSPFLRHYSSQKGWDSSPLQGFPGGSAVKNTPAMQEICRRHGFDPWAGKIPWRRNWQPTPVFLPEDPHRQRSLAGFSP